VSIKSLLFVRASTVTESLPIADVSVSIICNSVKLVVQLAATLCK
jgi:hypothetical protein